MLQPARFFHRIGGGMIGIHVHELEHLDPRGIAQQITNQVVMPELACIADERLTRVRQPRIVMGLQIPKVNVRIDNLHEYVLVPQRLSQRRQGRWKTGASAVCTGERSGFVSIRSAMLSHHLRMMGRSGNAAMVWSRSRLRVANRSPVVSSRKIQ